jgi:hypothetical protein
MQNTRIVWRWLLAVVLHVIVLVALLQLANVFFDGTIKELAESRLPQGVRLNDWLAYWESGWGQAIRMFMAYCAGAAFIVFIVWNVIFAIPSVIYKGSRMAKFLFFPAVIIVLAAEVLLGLLYRPVMVIEESNGSTSSFIGTLDLFEGSTAFYLSGLAFLVPFILSLALCSPYCIKSFKNWFNS